MQQLTLIPEPSKQQMVAEMLRRWLAYLDACDEYDVGTHPDIDLAMEKRDTAHKHYYTYMYRIKERYGLRYYELRMLLRGAEASREK